MIPMREGQQLIHGRRKLEKLRSKLNAGRSYAKTIALCIRTTKLTADVLKAAMRAYLRSHNQKKQQKMQSQRLESYSEAAGKKQNGGMTNNEITNKISVLFERYARKYGITMP